MPVRLIHIVTLATTLESLLVICSLICFQTAMNEFMAGAVELLFLMVLLSSVDEAASGGKAFRLSVSTSDGGVLCAVSDATLTMSISDLLTPGEHLPPQVVCARQCTSQAPCHSYNYRSDNSLCEFYDHPPTDCQARPNCQYFQVKRKT